MSNPDETTPNPSLNDTTKTTLISSFSEITSATPQEALFFLESHQWDLDAALSTFLDDTSAASEQPRGRTSRPREESSPEYSPSRSRSRSGSPEEEVGRRPYALRSRGKNKRKVEGSGGIRTLGDLNRTPDGDDDDEDEEPQEYYTGGEKSGMLVQDPTNRYDADAIFDHAKSSGSVLPTDRPSSSSRSFTGTARLLSGESVNVSAQPPESVTHTITLWRNGFTVNDGLLRRFDDPANASFLESIKRSECPRELEPADRTTKVHLDLMRREEDYSEPKKRQSKVLFQGVGRTLGSSSDSADPAASNLSAPSSLMTAPLQTSGLVIDSSLPTTSIQLRLSDGTRMVSRFNLNHTIRDMRAFIDASRPGAARTYQLQTMGFPPKPLTNLDQTIEEAGIANSVVIQKF